MSAKVTVTWTCGVCGTEVSIYRPEWDDGAGGEVLLELPKGWSYEHPMGNDTCDACPSCMKAYELQHPGWKPPDGYTK